MASSAPFRQDRTAYQDFQDRLSPTALQGPVGTAFESAFGAMKDAQLARLVASVKAKFPGIGPADALAAIGADRGMPRGGSESDAAYAARLLNAWNIWPWAGTAYGVLQAFYSTGYQNVVLAQVRGGKQFTLDNGGTNLLLWSSDPTNSAWVKAAGGTGAAPIVTKNFAAAPDGTLTAARVQFNQGAGATVNDFSTFRQIFSGGVVGQTYAIQVWLRTNDGSNTTIAFNATAPVIASGTLLAVTPTWQRFTIIGVTPVGGSSLWSLTIRGTFTTALTADILVAWPQIEQAATAGPTVLTYGINKPTAQAVGTMLTTAPANALWETDPLSSYSPVNQAFWSKFDVIFPLPLQAPGFSWAGGIPSSSSTEANFIRALIQAWKPAHATCNRIVIVQAGSVWGYPAAGTWGESGDTWGGDTETVWAP